MFLLDSEEIAFPDPALYDFEGGLLAMGGDLSPERIWFAYQNGIFPWFNPEDDILWWCPDPRFVLFPEDLKISKSLKKILRIFTRSRWCILIKRNLFSIIAAFVKPHI